MAEQGNFELLDVAIEEKYKAFCRFDVAWFNRPWLYLFCQLNLVKIIITFPALMLCGLSC